MSVFYPPVEAKNLTPFHTIKALLEKDPGYLDAAACPYEPEVKATIKKMMAGFGLMIADQAVALETAEDLEAQLNGIYSNLVTFGKNVGVNDTGDKIAWAKASMGLLDRIIQLRERVYNFKNYSDFQKRVFECLDGVVEPAQRSEFIEKLGKFSEKA